MVALKVYEKLEIYRQLWASYCLTMDKKQIVFLELYMKEIMASIKQVDLKIWQAFVDTLPGYASFIKSVETNLKGK